MGTDLRADANKKFIYFVLHYLERERERERKRERERERQRLYIESKKDGKDQESIQSSTTPDIEYQWEKQNVTNRHHKLDICAYKCFFGGM